MFNNKRTKEGVLLVPTTVRFPLSKITLFQHILINRNLPKNTTNNPSIKSSNKFFISKLHKLITVSTISNENLSNLPPLQSACRG